MSKIEAHPNGNPNGNGIKKVEAEKRNGGGITDVKRIKGASEQEMFLFLRQRLSGWRITYEPLGYGYIT